MTKVLRGGWTLRISAICFALACMAMQASGEGTPAKPAEELYLQLGRVGLDAGRVYKVRGASLNRPGIAISLDDGSIAFTQDVMGRITGAFFEGEGEILLTPPNEVERRSMSLFTGMAILEERFASAYFRFNDDAAAELQSGLRPAENKQELVDRWDQTAKTLAGADALRLLMTFSRMLPVGGGKDSGDTTKVNDPADRFLHARVQGTKLGVFDVFFDTTATEQVQAGQAKTVAGATYYDVWTSFSTRAAGTTSGERQPRQTSEWGHRIAVLVRRYTISTEVIPPKRIHSRAVVQCEVTRGEPRTLWFELSRFLQVESVKLDGEAVEFIHNPSVEGTQLARQGNDFVAVVLPRVFQPGQKFELEFAYGGEVLAEAGSGLLYVGERGTWYPNRGMEMADFDLEFRYPAGWTLVATGKPTPSAVDANSEGAEQRSRWVSERPIPLAGFNLGKYKETMTRAGEVTVETYATQGMERDFPSAPITVIQPNPNDPVVRPPEIVVPTRPSPAQNEARVGQVAARAIEYFSKRFGPFPYSHLALTQMPGRESQGWPGLVFLSSYVFLDELPREAGDSDLGRKLLRQSVPAHETAHQWWGDLVTWSTYRDQWFSEGLADYCTLMMVQEREPNGFREIMERYRRDLVEKNKDGIASMDAGPVTLGSRLFSSRLPHGYEAISYGRGTWLFHMLRSMLKDAAEEKGAKPASVDEPFVRGLRKVRERYQGRSMSTREMLDVFAEELPPSLRYEGKKSLDWFLDGWINGTALPKLELKTVRFTTTAKGLVVSGTILQKDAPQDLVTSVPVYGVASGKQQPVLLGRVFADGEESSFRLAAPVGVHKVVLDPYGTVLTAPK